MQKCPCQLAIQSCVLCSFVRCGSSNQIEGKEKKTVLKMTFPKLTPKIITYRNYKNFDNNAFSEEISRHCNITSFEDIDDNFQSFLDVCIKALENLPQKSQKYIRANKILNKAIMNRSRLRNKLLKKNTDVNKAAYNMQRKYVVSLLRKSKGKYYNSLDTKKIIKLFGKLLNHFFQIKSPVTTKLN